jgi:hypothetical protein
VAILIEVDVDGDEYEYEDEDVVCRFFGLEEALRKEEEKRVAWLIGLILYKNYFSTVPDVVILYISGARRFHPPSTTTIHHPSLHKTRNGRGIADF